MTKIIKFPLKELKTLVSDKNSCIEEKQVTQKLALQPWCLGNLVDSIKNVLDFKIGKYDEQYSGILLCYKNLKVENLGAIRNDQSEITLEIQGDYFIFRPYIGALLRGIVNKKSVTHLGVIVHRVFNVVIPRPTNTNDIRWIGTTIMEGQHIVFRIVMMDLFGALPYIRGELDERYLLEQEDLTPGKIESRLLVNHVHFQETKPPKSKPEAKSVYKDIEVKSEICTEDIKVKLESDIKQEVVISEEPSETKVVAKRLSRPRRSVAIERKSYYEEDKLTDEEIGEAEPSKIQPSLNEVSSARTPKKVRSSKRKNTRSDQELVLNKTTEISSDTLDEIESSITTPSRQDTSKSIVQNSGDAPHKSSTLKRKLNNSSDTVRERKRKTTI